MILQVSFYAELVLKENIFINFFIFTFVQFNLSLMNKSIFFKKKKKSTDPKPLNRGFSKGKHILF